VYIAADINNNRVANPKHWEIPWHFHDASQQPRQMWQLPMSWIMV